MLQTTRSSARPGGAAGTWKAEGGKEGALRLRDAVGGLDGEAAAGESVGW